MKFYSKIADYYKYIFPLNLAQLKFIQSEIDTLENANLLDIGCAIGELSNEVSKHCKSVDAIDLDAEMIEKAKNSFESENLRFHKMNMLEIDSVFDAESFDAVYSFGNTIVHLADENEIQNLFEKVYRVLKPNSKFLFQIINYDRILDNQIHSLPTIENEHIKFDRIYDYEASDMKIIFKTSLEIKSENSVIESKVDLFPIRSKQIEKLLSKTGFHNIRFFSNFKKEDFKSQSTPLVVSAEKG